MLIGRRQSLDNILGPTSEKVKEIFSHGIMMLNISSLTERRNSEPKLGITEDRPRSSTKKIPSPLDRTLTYLNVEDDNSDTESLSRFDKIKTSLFLFLMFFLFSVDMLNEDQINSLMLDREIGAVCEQVLGTPITEVVQFPASTISSHVTK